MKSLILINGIKKFTFKIVFLTGLLCSSVLALDYGNPHEDEAYVIPKRHLSIIASKEGYYPQSIPVFRGERVTIYLTTTDDSPSCLIMSDKNIFMSAQKGKVSEVQVFFDKPGDIPFYCPNGNLKGHFRVLSKNKIQKREVASDKKVNVWRPKEAAPGTY